MKLAIITMFKNESMGLREWLEHYKWQGVDRILLLNNNSTDDWRSKIQGFESFVDIVDVAKNHAQTEHYNTVGMPWLLKNGIDVVGVIDIDEYVYCDNGKSIKGTLERLFTDDTLGKVQLTWRIFGSSGANKQPPSIRKGFTWRKRDDPTLNMKCFSRVRDLLSLQIHDHETRGTSVRDPPGIYLNHYVIQSREFFKKVKMRRGDGQHTDANSMRNWNYFAKKDFREVEDTELKKQVEALERGQRGGRRRTRRAKRRRSKYHL